MWMSAKVDVRLRRRCGPFAELLWPFVLLIHLHSELEFTSVQLSSTGANRACVRWVAYTLQICESEPCGMQTRPVVCTDPLGNCDVASIPDLQRRCSNHTCGAWNTGHWSTVCRLYLHSYIRCVAKKYTTQLPLITLTVV